MNRTARFAVVLGLLGAFHSSVLGAQEPDRGEPLRKSDVIRLLSGDTYTDAEIASIIRRSCLSFRPTERDLDDFRTMGADTEILGAVDRCTRLAGDELPEFSAPTEEEIATQRAPRPPPVEVELILPATVTTSAASTVRVDASLQAGSTPRPGVTLSLRPAAAVPATLSYDSIARTEDNGTATFVITAPEEPGTYLFEVGADGVPLVGQNTLTLLVGSAPAAAADLEPSNLRLVAETADLGLVTVTVRDAFGNIVADQEVALVTADDRAARVARGQTDRAGSVTLRIPVSAIETGQLDLLAGSTYLATLPVEVVRMADWRLRFVSGTAQTGAVGELLPQRLVFELLDAAGSPIAGQRVTVWAANGVLDSETVTTDSMGRASVQVVRGSQPDPTVVTVSVGPVREQAVFVSGPQS